MAERERATFGTVLRSYRQAASLSQESLAARAGLSAKGIAELESGRRRAPRPETVTLLAAALDLAPAERAALIAAAGRARIGGSSQPNLPGAPSLPPPLTPLIGRERELAAVTNLLAQPEIRLLTLTGPGGVGKTRLAQQVASTCGATFAYGIVVVALAPLRDPALVLPTIAQNLGLRDGGEQLLRDRLVGHLHDKDLLLLLDNCEQVAQAAPQVSDVLGACPRLRVLATSRAPLHVRGEQEFTVPPLMLPDLAQVADLQTLSQVPAVALFVQRAQAVRPEFALTAANAAPVAALCRRLDGLPLALELAAPRLKVLPPQALLERLDHQMEVLSSGPQDLPERQQTLRATLDWSYDLLEPAAQGLFRRLAVFAGGCTLEATEAVGGGGTSSEVASGVLGRLGALVDQSLLYLEEPEDAGEPRLEMLETIRAYGLERLAASGESPEIRRRHATWYLELAETAEPALRGPDQVRWLERLERERDNLRAALVWARGQGETEVGLRIAGALWRFWYLHGYASEGRRWLDALLAQNGADGSFMEGAVRAKALRCAGGLASYQGDYERAWMLYSEARRLYDGLGDEENCAGIRLNLGLAAHRRGDDEHAVLLFEESLALARGLDDGSSVIAAVLANLGNLAWRRGDVAQGQAFMEESLALCRARRDTFGVAGVLVELATLLLREQGDAERAVVFYRESLALSEAGSYVKHMARCLEGLAGLAVAKGQVERATRLLGAAATLRQRSGNPPDPEEHADADRTVAAVRAALGDGAFTAAWEQGQMLQPGQSLAEAHDI